MTEARLLRSEDDIPEVVRVLPRQGGHGAERGRVNSAPHVGIQVPVHDWRREALILLGIPVVAAVRDGHNVVRVGGNRQWGWQRECFPALGP